MSPVLFNPYPSILDHVDLPQFFAEALDCQVRTGPDGGHVARCPWCLEGHVSMTGHRFECPRCTARGTVVDAAALHIDAERPGQAALWLIDRYQLPLEDYVMVQAWRRDARGETPADWRDGDLFNPYKLFGGGKYHPVRQRSHASTAERLHADLSGEGADPRPDAAT